jgi:hypothetical protein
LQKDEDGRVAIWVQLQKGGFLMATGKGKEGQDLSFVRCFYDLHPSSLFMCWDRAHTLLPWWYDPWVQVLSVRILCCWVSSVRSMLCCVSADLYGCSKWSSLTLVSMKQPICSKTYTHRGCGTYLASLGLRSPSRVKETTHFLQRETHRPDDVPGSNLPAVQLKALNKEQKGNWSWILPMWCDPLLCIENIKRLL